MELGLLAYGAYLPVRRMQREAVASTHAWFNPGLKGLGKGERTIANWDEDAVTMAVEASRSVLEGQDRDSISALWLASTSLPFRDRQNSGIVGDALRLEPSAMTLDVASSQRAGTTALMAALRGNGEGASLVVASERRATKAGSTQEMTYGDGAAALLVGQGDVVARLIGARTEAVDFVDHYRGADGEFDYAWEERWVRDEGHMKIAPRAIAALLENTGVASDSITRFCYPAAARGVAAKVAQAAGLPNESVADTLQSVVGETGAAHPLLMLTLALETAEPGDRILVASFGQGCDVLLFEATDAIRRRPRSRHRCTNREGPDGRKLRSLHYAQRSCHGGAGYSCRTRQSDRAKHPLAQPGNDPTDDGRPLHHLWHQSVPPQEPDLRKPPRMWRSRHAARRRVL